MEPLFKATVRPTLLTNDFYSWKKESAQPHARVTNAVLFYMNTGMTEQEAVVQLKQDILEKESVFLKMRDSFCREHPDLPSHLKLMVNILAPLIGGYHYWCCLCPRYNCLQNPSAYAKSNNTSLESGCDKSCTSTHSSMLHIAERLRSSKMNSGNLSSIAAPKLGQTALEGPIRYIQSLDSKNVRLQLIDAFNLWLGLPSPALNTIKEIVNDLHNSSLILDDIQDGSLLDEGKFSYPIVRLCTDPVRKDIVVRLLHQRDTPETTNLPVESKLQILEVMGKAGAIHETWRLVIQLQNKVQEEIGRLEAVLGQANPILRVLIKVLGNIPSPCKQL
jgi:hypothetical protein